MTDKRTPDSDGSGDTSRLRSRAVEASNTARISILIAAVLVAYPNADPARAGNPAREVHQMASLPFGSGESLAPITLPEVTVLASPTYSEPSTNGDGPRVIGPCSRGGDGRIVCQNFIPPLHYNR
jgi:hypothetical protein